MSLLHQFVSKCILEMIRRSTCDNPSFHNTIWLGNSFHTILLSPSRHSFKLLLQVNLIVIIMKKYVQDIGLLENCVINKNQCKTWNTYIKW